ncbi:unnamed protein product [Amoebophrya sp. A25]|nr:unnamed protein product [Amoebophrya sp. A25]|eukprot:GSA25T00015926001.1
MASSGEPKSDEEERQAVFQDEELHDQLRDGDNVVVASDVDNVVVHSGVVEVHQQPHLTLARDPVSEMISRIETEIEKEEENDQRQSVPPPQEFYQEPYQPSSLSEPTSSRLSSTRSQIVPALSSTGGGSTSTHKSSGVMPVHIEESTSEPEADHEKVAADKETINRMMANVESLYESARSQLGHTPRQGGEGEARTQSSRMKIEIDEGGDLPQVELPPAADVDSELHAAPKSSSTMRTSTAWAEASNTRNSAPPARHGDYERRVEAELQHQTPSLNSSSQFFTVSQMAAAHSHNSQHSTSNTTNPMNMNRGSVQQPASFGGGATSRMPSASPIASPMGSSRGSLVASSGLLDAPPGVNHVIDPRVLRTTSSSHLRASGVRLGGGDRMLTSSPLLQNRTSSPLLQNRVSSPLSRENSLLNALGLQSSENSPVQRISHAVGKNNSSTSNAMDTPPSGPTDLQHVEPPPQRGNAAMMYYEASESSMSESAVGSPPARGRRVLRATKRKEEKSDRSKRL